MMEGAQILKNKKKQSNIIFENVMLWELWEYNCDYNK